MKGTIVIDEEIRGGIKANDEYGLYCLQGDIWLVDLQKAEKWIQNNTKHPLYLSIHRMVGLTKRSVGQEIKTLYHERMELLQMIIVLWDRAKEYNAPCLCSNLEEYVTGEKRGNDEILLATNGVYDQCSLCDSFILSKDTYTDINDDEDDYDEDEVIDDFRKIKICVKCFVKRRCARNCPACKPSLKEICPQVGKYPTESKRLITKKGRR